MKPLIQKLVESTGPSGYETAVRNLVRAEVEKYADTVSVDALGNLIARKGQKGEGGLRIMLAAHMDEIGLIVTHIDENGFARFTTIGGVGTRTCLGGQGALYGGRAGCHRRRAAGTRRQGAHHRAAFH